MVVYTCDKCNEKFDHKIAYDRHKNRKTDCIIPKYGSKSSKKRTEHRCPVCDKIYSRKDSLARHKSVCKGKVKQSDTESDEDDVVTDSDESNVDTEDDKNNEGTEDENNEDTEDENNEDTEDDESDKKDTVKKKAVSNKDTMTRKMKVSEVEDMLDREIPQYNRYTKENPMLGISWNKTKKIWLVRFQDMNIDTKRAKIEDAANIVTCAITSSLKKQKKILKNEALSYITYKHKHICIYNTVDNPLFDIMHIVKLLDVSDMNKKYNQFKDLITHYGFKKNEFGGYIMKEFISEKSVYQLVLSSNSALSKEFKIEVSEILADLRKSSHIAISNDKLKLMNPDIKRQDMRDDDVNNQLSSVSKHSNNKISYDNLFYLEMIKTLVKNGSLITIQLYAEQHVLYCFILGMCDPEGMNRIFVKIGYTFDIINRIKQLRTEYNCEVYLIGIKYVNSEQVEKKFHSGIKTTTKDLAYTFKIDGKKKDEVYLFSESLYEEFMAVQDSKPTVNKVSQVDIHIEQMIKNQYMYFVKYTESITAHSLISQIRPDGNEHYQNVLIKYLEINKEKYLAELEFYNKEKERECRLQELDKNIEMKKLELEIAKARK